jgi:hypothetical protein
MSTPHLAVTTITTGSSKIRRTATSPQALGNEHNEHNARPLGRMTFAPRLAPTDEPWARRWYEARRNLHRATGISAKLGVTS